MTFIPNTTNSTTSASGINSATNISGTNWVANVFTGAGEQNNYSYVGVNLQVDESGTLTFQFSQDGTNWSSYPVTQFTISSGVNEVHGAWKGTRYVRPIFTGDDGSRSYFRLSTMYSNQPIALTAPLNQSIGSDQDATVTRAVLTGQSPNNDFVAQKTDGLGFSTTALLSTNGNSYTSGVLNLEGYTQVQTRVLSDTDGTVDTTFYSDSAGTDLLRTLSIPYTGGSGFKMFSEPAFTPYVKYTYTSTEDGQSDFYFDTKFTTKSISGQILGTDAFISSQMVANLGRNIVVGQDPNDAFVNQKVDGIAFRTETLLTSGTSLVYTSPITSTSGYSQIETHLFADVSGTLVGTWYNDSSKTTTMRTFTRPYANGEVGTTSYFSAPIFGPYVQYVFTSDSDQSEFFLDFHPRTKSISGQVLGMNDYIPSGVVANLGRHVIVGQDANDEFHNTNVTYDGNLEVRVADPLTAFGDLRVAELTPVIQMQFPYNIINTDIVNVVTANSGTVTGADSMAALSTSTNTTGSAQLESIRQIKYRPGLGSLVRFTALFTTGVSGAVQISGVGNNTDGLFFGYNGATFGIMIRQNGSDTWTAQSAWSEDILDGTGCSKMNIDQTKLNVFSINYQWLGAGQITFKIEDPVTGTFVNVHKFKYANSNTVPPVYNPTFSLLMNATKTSGTTDIIIKTASMAGFIEGKSIVTGPTNTYASSNSHSAETILFSIRNKSTYGGAANRIAAYLTSIAMSNDANQLATFKIHLNATLGGTPSWANVNGDNSIAEVDTAGTLSSTGRILFISTVGKDSGQTFIFPEEKYFFNPGDVISVSSLAGTAGEMGVSLSWQEDF